jgi:hypothetical protein
MLVATNTRSVVATEMAVSWLPDSRHFEGGGGNSNMDTVNTEIEQTVV